MTPCLSGGLDHHWRDQGGIWSCLRCGADMPPELRSNSLRRSAFGRAYSDRPKTGVRPSTRKAPEQPRWWLEAGIDE